MEEPRPVRQPKSKNRLAAGPPHKLFRNLSKLYVQSLAPKIVCVYIVSYFWKLYLLIGCARHCDQPIFLLSSKLRRIHRYGRIAELSQQPNLHRLYRTVSMFRFNLKSKKTLLRSVACNPCYNGNGYNSIIPKFAYPGFPKKWIYVFSNFRSKPGSREKSKTVMGRWLGSRLSPGCWKGWGKFPQPFGSKTL